MRTTSTSSGFCGGELCGGGEGDATGICANELVASCAIKMVAGSQNFLMTRAFVGQLSMILTVRAIDELLSVIVWETWESLLLK